MSTPIDAEDRRALEQANSSFYTAVETGDLDLLGAVWLDGPDAGGVACVHPGWPVVRGRSEVLRSFALILANVPYIQFFLTDVDVRTSGTVAVVSCVENTLTALDDEEDPAAGFAGGRVVATNIFQQWNGQWRLWMHHASPVLALDGDEDDDDPGFEDDPEFADPDDPQGTP